MIIALFLTGCGTAAVAQGQGTEMTPPRTLSVNGTAQVFLTPDIAYLSIGVHTENENVAEAVASNNTQAQQVIDALKAAGIDEKDIRTSNFSIYPSQQYTPEGQVKASVFVVDNTVYVTIRDITGLGEILEASVASGANNITGIQFDVADKTSALSEARKAAVANAKAQATELAQAAGVELGPIHSINVYNSYPMPVYESKAMGGMDMAQSFAPISPGQLNLTVDVNVVYEIR